MDFLQRFFDGIKAYVKRFTLTQILLMAGIFIVTLVGLLLAVGAFKSMSYSVLYSDLPEKEAGEVTTSLNEMGIDYKLSDGGRTIRVPAEKVHSTRITLATQGIPTGGSVGYSIFDKTNLGMTEFVQKVNYRRALEGELSRTIADLEEVRAARVHIVIPEKRLFEEDQKKTTASVVLKLSGPGSLNKRQLFGISHLVASSVEGLQTDNITIVDNWGNLLSSPQTGDPMIALSATQLEMKKAVESYLESKAQSILSGALGNSRAIVKIDADLDFDQVSKSIETYDPDQTAVRSEEKQEFTAADSSSSVGTDTLNTGGREISERTITNYEVSRTVETVASSVGTIKKLSVAVMVDGSYEEVETENGDLEQQYIPRDEAELDQLSSIVQRAVGFDSTRADEFSIVNFAFDTKNLVEEQPGFDFMGQYSLYFEIGKKVLIAIGIILAFFYVKGKLKKAIKAVVKMSPPPPPPKKPTRPEPEEEIEVEPPKPKLADKMRSMAKDQPDELTKVIKTMMSE
jgi:flagellar M-ring protein FliF